MTDEEKKIRKKESDKKYRLKNTKKIKMSSKKYRIENDGKEKARHKKYRVENCEKIKQYRDEHKEEKKIYDKSYRSQNAEKIRGNRITRDNPRNKIKRRTNPMFKMKANLVSRTSTAFKTIGKGKPAKTTQLLGTTYDVVKIHIEQQFKDNMTWENYGKWHIDHIIPLASARDIDELIALCHYSNLQPLWAEENLQKRDKINWKREKASLINPIDTILTKSLKEN